MATFTAGQVGPIAKAVGKALAADPTRPVPYLVTVVEDMFAQATTAGYTGTNLTDFVDLAMQIYLSPKMGRLTGMSTTAAIAQAGAIWAAIIAA
jgi:hypothetical protein